MIYRSTIFVLLFLGGWSPLFSWPKSFVQNFYPEMAVFRDVFSKSDAVSENVLSNMFPWPLTEAQCALLGALFLSVKVVLVLFVFIWVRATFPRYRYDQLMSLGWKVYLPFVFCFFVFYMCLLALLGFLPVSGVLLDDFDPAFVWPALGLVF